MLYVHPLMQLAAIAILIYVAALGFSRVRSLHLGHSARFNRKQHIRWGKVCLVVLGAGSIGGLIMVRVFMGGWLVSDLHGRVGVALIPLIAFGLASGMYMEQRPAQRKVLPLLHGLCNLLLGLLCLGQAYGGAQWVWRLWSI